MEKKPNFTTPCFIRKNTPELCKKLEKLGYIKSQFFDEEEEWLICNPSDYTGNIISGEYWSFGEDSVDIDETLEDYGIDCGENEKLFFALAALREDSDKFQWFTGGIEWYYYVSDNWNDEKNCFDYENNTDLVGFFPSEYHKATPSELIKHFKDTR